MKKHLIVICVIGFSVQMHGQEILNKEWIVTEIGKEKITVDAEKTPWIKLSEGRVSGFSACNRLMGSYSLDGKTLTFDRLGGTKMFCFEVHELEDKFMLSLSKTHYWKYKCGKLSLFDKDNVLIMKLKIKKISHEK